MPPIFQGLGNLFDDALGLTGNDRYGRRRNRPKYKSRRAAIALSGNGGPMGNGEPVWQALIQAAMERLAANLPAENWHPAASNWRWDKKLRLARHNLSPEKTLEKVMAFLLDTSWVNQVPICNGLVNNRRADAARVDLVHHVEHNAYELIELKFGTDASGGSDHPLSAVMEVMQYGLMYLLFRQRDFGITQAHHLLNAGRINLVVLAPRAWYQFRVRGDPHSHSFDLRWLANGLGDGFRAYADANNIKLQVEIEYRVLSPGFHANYLSLLGHIQAFRDSADTLSIPFAPPNADV